MIDFLCSTFNNNSVAMYARIFLVSFEIHSVCPCRQIISYAIPIVKYKISSTQFFQPSRRTCFLFIHHFEIYF